MIVLSGAAGFIGSSILAALDAEGRDDTIVDDRLVDGRKGHHLDGRRFADDLDGFELEGAIRAGTLPQLSAICRQGGCTDGSIADGQAAMRDSETFSKTTLGVRASTGDPSSARAVPACAVTVGQAFASRPTASDL